LASATLLSPLIKFTDLGDGDDHDMYWAYHMQACQAGNFDFTHLNMDNDVVTSAGVVYDFADQTWADYVADPTDAACSEQWERLVDFWPSKFQHPGYQKYDNHHADFKNDLNSETPVRQLLHYAQNHREGFP